jgi:hypothetical protein
MSEALGVAERGLSIVHLDELASEAEKPYGIITVDCSNPKEIDDGISVEVLPAAQELYRVKVFVVDTSKLYSDEHIVRKVLRKTEARYLNPQSDAEGYEPMLEDRYIKNLEFSAGTARSALIVSFIAGPTLPPDDVSIEYGQVEVVKNFRYDKFGRKCRYDEKFWHYGRAAAAILSHLRTDPGDDEQIHNELIHVPKHEVFRRGADINQAFMVAANYLVAKTMLDEPLAIYRTHDLDDTTYDELISSRVARFSIRPAPHHGLGLDVYTRVTSPLRRAEDFFMHGLLRARYEGRAINGRDKKLITSAIQRLNQRVVTNVFNGRSQDHDEDSWLRESGSEPEQLAS